MVNKILIAFLFIVYLSGCAKKYTHKSFEPEAIDRITILPFMDKRENPDSDIDFEKMSYIGNRLMSHVLRYSKNYRTVVSTDIGNVSSYLIQDLPSFDQDSASGFLVDSESVDPGWIKQLGPSTGKWLLVPVIESITFTNLLIEMSATAKVSAYLFNKYTGELWWYCSDQARFSAGVLVYAIMSAASPDENVLERTVIKKASQDCINKLPERSSSYILSNN